MDPNTELTTQLVLGALAISITQFTLNLGTYASQFDQGHAKLDLKNLFDKVADGELDGTVLQEFNLLEQDQYGKLQN